MKCVAASDRVQTRTPSFAAVKGAWIPRRELEASLGAIETALVLEPDSAELLFQRAAHLQMLGCDAASREAYVRALERDPDHLGALSNLGRALILNRNHCAARTVLERAVLKHPGDLDSHVALGIAYYQMKQMPAARDVLLRALQIAPSDARAHLGLAFVLQSQGDARQAQAHRVLGLAGRAPIRLPYKGQGSPLRVLLLATADRANAPLARHLDDRIFETWLVSPEFHDLASVLPEHDLVVNAIGDADAAPQALRMAGALLERSAAPFVNAPARVAATGRCDNWRRLGALPGVVTPHAATLCRAVLSGAEAVAHLQRHGLRFPLLLRSPGYHGGENFVRVDRVEELANAVQALPGEELIAAEFIDTSSADGKTRKYRVMLVDGELYPLHLAVGSHWKLHYFSADMSENAAHRAEDERFLNDMAAVLSLRAMRALHAIGQCLALDYGGIDFGIDAQGQVVVFEANATMVVPDPGADACWTYRLCAVQRIRDAVHGMLLRRARRKDAADIIDRPYPIVVAQRPGELNESNFSAGPGALPLEVLKQLRQALIALPETGVSVLGMSHRSTWFEALLEEAQVNLRRLLGIPSSHRLLFLQGGSSLQFSMIPMNFAPESGPRPLHLRTGHWSAKAIEEGKVVRPIDLAWDGAPHGYRRLPKASEWLAQAQALREAMSAPAPYLHYVTNETVEGLQWRHTPTIEDTPLIADMSSDFLSRPIDITSFALIYAHAQKNLGPAGVTVCIVDQKMLARIPAGLPPMLDYRTHLRHNSNYNTPPVFAIYVVTLVTRWLRDVIGGVAQMERINRAKAARLYGALGRLQDVVESHAEAASRSDMNVCFRFRDPALNARFVQKAAAAGFLGLGGHRALGGIRVSLYNAVPDSAVARLCEFLEDFAHTHS